MVELNKPLVDKKKVSCAERGSKYETQIFNVVKSCMLNGIPFNTQNEEDLAGSSSKNDIICNYIDKRRYWH